MKIGIRSAASGFMTAMQEHFIPLRPEELIRKLEETLRENATRHAPRAEGFFEGVKRFFSGGHQ